MVCSLKSSLTCYVCTFQLLHWPCFISICVIHVQTPHFKKVLFLSVYETSWAKSWEKGEREEWKGLGEQEKFSSVCAALLFPLWSGQHSYVDQQTSAIALTTAKGQNERPSYREQFDDEMLTWDQICAMWHFKQLW